MYSNHQAQMYQIKQVAQPLHKHCIHIFIFLHLYHLQLLPFLNILTAPMTSYVFLEHLTFIAFISLPYHCQSRTNFWNTPCGIPSLYFNSITLSVLFVIPFTVLQSLFNHFLTIIIFISIKITVYFPCLF